LGETTVALKLWRRNDSGLWYIRGTDLSGANVYESTKTKDAGAAEKIRVKREGEALSVVLNGAILNCTFDQAAGDHVDNGGDDTFIGKLVGHFGDRIIRTIAQSELDEAGRVLYPNCQPQTVNRQCHSPFIAVWNRAAQNGYCELRKWSRPEWGAGNKFNGVKLKAKPRVGSFGVEYGHAAPFVLAMSPAPAMVLTALFYTGMRPSELFKLTDKMVDLKNRMICIDRRTKTKKARRVPIHDVLLPLLTALVKRGGILFRTPRGEPYPVADDEKVSGQMKSAINGARKRSGIKDIAPYTARHTVSSKLVEAGVHEFVKDEILGHRFDDPSHTYTNVSDKTLVDAINKLPVVKAWASAPWMSDPIAYASKLVEGTGERTDLAKLKVRREKWAKAVAKKKATVRQRKHREIKKAA
jgi:integrase/recombinase XerD